MRASRNGARIPRIRSAPRSGTKRSTASRRRPRTSCASRSRAPAPAVNSATRGRTISTAWGWCPAPRRSAHGRCRDRACSAPRRHDAGEQRQRLVDQVVVIEQAAALFLARVARDHVVGDGEQAPRCGRGRSTARRRSSSAQTRSCSATGARPSPCPLIALVTMICAARAHSRAENVEIGFEPVRPAAASRAG